LEADRDRLRLRCVGKRWRFEVRGWRRLGKVKVEVQVEWDGEGWTTQERLRLRLRLSEARAVGGLRLEVGGNCALGSL